MVTIIQSNTIKNLMSAKDDTVTIAISKPETLVNSGCELLVLG